MNWLPDTAQTASRPNFLSPSGTAGSLVPVPTVGYVYVFSVLM
jgi:hypothetical protein